MRQILSYDSGTIAANLSRSRRILVQGLSFSVCAGESLALIGETGSGKTMAAQSILNTLPPNVSRHGGHIAFCGQPLCSGRQIRHLLGAQIVYIPQNGSEFLNPSRRICDQMADGLKKLGVPYGERRAAALEGLRLVGFDEPEAVLRAYPFQLSGGMAQRVTIALAACSEAKLIIADEPTNGLDERACRTFFGLLDRLFPKAARIFITHDVDVAAMCSRTIVLCGGRPVESGASSEVLTAPKHPYTRALCCALVRNGMQETPVLRSGSSPCAFYRRCAAACEACLQPPRKQEDNGREWWCSAS